MEEKGHVRLFRKFVFWEWYKEQNTKSLFIHCLLKANWKDTKFEGEEIRRGSFATSLNTLQKETGLSKQEVRTALKHLISTQELTQEQCGKFSIITIINYEKYQQANTLSNTELTQSQHRANTDSTQEQSKTNTSSNTELTQEKPRVNRELTQEQFKANTLSNTELTQNQHRNNQNLTPIEEYKNNNIYNNIYSTLEKIFNRELNSFEIEVVSKWKVDELTKHAIKQAATNHIYNVNYINAILEAYEKENITTIEQVLRREEQFKKLKSKKNLNSKVEANVPFWFNKHNEKENLTEEERKELDDILNSL